jgi:DNA polymerase-3 subunit gamma/tau
MIARAAEGSVRDSLSLLDQAIAYGGREVQAGDVQSMLGLADRARSIDLFEAVMKGDMASALGEFEAQHALGGDPSAILTDLADFVHWVTRLKLVPDAVSDAARSEAEVRRGREFAAALGMPHLARAWQMLLKGLEEVGQAPNPKAAAEMVLVRLAYAAELPDPARLARQTPEAAPAASPPLAARAAPASREPVSALRSAGSLAPRPEAAESPPSAANAASTAAGAASSAPTSFAGLVALAAERRDLKLKADLERLVRPVAIAPGKLEIALEPGAGPGLPGEIARKLEAWTGQRWLVLVAQEGGEPPLAEQARGRRDGLFREAREHPSVKAVLERFPGAEIVDVRERDLMIASPDPAAEEEPE